MENFILENSFATIKQSLLPSDDTRHKFYLVIHGDKENLNYKIVSQEKLKDVENILFKKLYCISKEENFQLLNLVTVQNQQDFKDIALTKSLTHPSVKILKEISKPKPLAETTQVKVSNNPFDAIKKSKKPGLNKESFFAAFKKHDQVEKNENSAKVAPKTSQTSIQDSEVIVKTESAAQNCKHEKASTNQDSVVVKKKSSVQNSKKLKANTNKDPVVVAQKKSVQKKAESKASDKSLDQEATLKDMFENDHKGSVIEDDNHEDGEKEEEEVSQEMIQPRKGRKKRKVIKTMTFSEGKYIKTRDVETWESYSESENEKTSGNAFSELPKKRKSQSQQQHSISSFFTKK